MNLWIREGLRAGVFLAPRVGGRQPRPVDLLLVLALSTALELGIGRLEVPGPADFNAAIWLAYWWGTAAAILLVWALTWGQPRAEGQPAGVAGWFTLWLMAALPASLAGMALAIALARDAIPPAWLDSTWFSWGTYIVLWAWIIGVAIRLGWHFGLQRGRLAALGTGLFAIIAVSIWQFPGRTWEAQLPPLEEPVRLSLSQDTFENQQKLWDRSLANLAAQRPGVVDVYGLVFAPYAPEDVFLRESTLVADLLAQRFDARGRVLQLVNNPVTAESLPWATPTNLKRAVAAIAQRMDREQDVLVVYLTSHGASNFQLAASNPPLEVESLSPGELRVALDEAGIRHRVIAISACYSGGWVGPLGSDTTLVMTAADSEHTSYGCGRLSELTFFGRAVFGEELRKTHSFEQAFAAAVPVIKQREEEARKPDGFSNPQISVGEKIKPVLRALELRLDGATPKS